MPRFPIPVMNNIKPAELVIQDTIYIRRPGGLGDVILCAILVELLSYLIPVFRTNYKICFVTKKQYHEFLEHFPGIDFCKTEYNGVKNNPFFYDLYSVADNGLSPRTKTRWAIFAEKIGVPFEPSKIKLKSFPRKKGEDFIGVVPFATTKNRTWDGMMQLAERLAKDNTIAIIDNEYMDLRKAYINLTGLTLMEVIKELKSRCRMIVTPDTGILHLAMLLKIPTVSIFGPIDPKLRVWRPEYVDVIQSKIDCCPCHEFLSHNCPPGHYLECLKKITVDEVYGRVKTWKKKWIG